jgi:hypothetical protein
MAGNVCLDGGRGYNNKKNRVILKTCEAKVISALKKMNFISLSLSFMKGDYFL